MIINDVNTIGNAVKAPGCAESSLKNKKHKNNPKYEIRAIELNKFCLEIFI